MDTTESLEQKLMNFANTLAEYEGTYENYHSDGTGDLERLEARAKGEAIREVGELLKEILES